MPTICVGITYCVHGGWPFPDCDKPNGPRIFYAPGYPAPTKIAMKNNVLINRLKTIPSHSSVAIVDGVTMIVIDTLTKEHLLDKDPQDHTYHECKLRNGTFVFQTDEDHRLTKLYKVMDRADTYRKE